MGTFLRGWRRKIGCVMLAMALVSCGAWIRSFVVADDILLSTSIARSHEFSSELGEVRWISSEQLRWRKFQYDTFFVGTNPTYDLIDHWDRNCPIRYTVQTSMGPGFRLRTVELIVAYWMIVSPLTLLSALLLLCPAKRIPKPTARAVVNAAASTTESV